LSLLILNLGLKERVFGAVGRKSISRQPQKEDKSRQTNASQNRSQVEFETVPRILKVVRGIRRVSGPGNRSLRYLTCQHKTHCIKLLW
jgi:hypothetical protein